MHYRLSNPRQRETEAAASPEQIRLIRANIHPPAHSAIVDWSTFPCTKTAPAFRIRTFLTHPRPSVSVSGALSRIPTLKRHGRALAVMLSDPRLSIALDAAPELHLEFTDREVLNEKGAGIPTNVDALLLYPGLALVVESKLRNGLDRALRFLAYCTGRYEVGSDLKTLTAALCRLEIQDGRRSPRRYWEVMRALSEPTPMRAARCCPFAGPGTKSCGTSRLPRSFAARGVCRLAMIFAFPESCRRRAGVMSTTSLPSSGQRPDEGSFSSTTNNSPYRSNIGVTKRRWPCRATCRVVSTDSGDGIGLADLSVPPRTLRDMSKPIADLQPNDRPRERLLSVAQMSSASESSSH